MKGRILLVDDEDLFTKSLAASSGFLSRPVPFISLTLPARRSSFTVTVPPCAITASTLFATGGDIFLVGSSLWKSSVLTGVEDALRSMTLWPFGPESLNEPLAENPFMLMTMSSTASSKTPLAVLSVICPEPDGETRGASHVEGYEASRFL